MNKNSICKRIIKIMGIFSLGTLLLTLPVENTQKPAHAKLPNNKCNIKAQNKLLITLPLSAEKSLVPKEYRFSIKAEVKSTTERRVIRILAKLDEEVRKLNTESNINYSGGKFYLSPIYHRLNVKRIHDGYKGSISYTFKAKDFAFQEKVIRVFKTIKSIFPTEFSYYIRRTDWVLSHKQVKKAKAKLMLRLLRDAKKLTKIISKLLSRECTLKEVNYTDIPVPVYPAIYKSSVIKSLAVPKPKKEEQRVEVRAMVKISCF